MVLNEGGEPLDGKEGNPEGHHGTNEEVGDLRTIHRIPFVEELEAFEEGGPDHDGNRDIEGELGARLAVAADEEGGQDRDPAPGGTGDEGENLGSPNDEGGLPRKGREVVDKRFFLGFPEEKFDHDEGEAVDNQRHRYGDEVI